jgi:hypothetical protein
VILKLSLIATNVTLGFLYLIQVIILELYWLFKYSFPYDLVSLFDLLLNLLSLLILIAILALIIFNTLNLLKNNFQYLTLFAIIVTFLNILYFVKETFDFVLINRRLGSNFEFDHWINCFFTGCLNKFETYNFDLILIGSLISLLTTIFIILNLLLSVIFNHNRSKS